MLELRLVILGNGGVGKSAITVQYVQNHFIEIYDPTIEDCYRKQADVDGTMYLLDIMDTAGQEEYTALRDQYMHSGDGFVIVYSITNRKSFEDIEIFVERIYMNKNSRDVPIVLCGNKCDNNIIREVTIDEGISMAKKIKCPFFECSAKLRYNIDEIWHSIVREVLKKKLKKPIKKKEKCLLL